MWTQPGIDVFDELDSRAGLQPAHLIKWNPFLDEAAAVLELESCEDLVIGVLDHFLENEPSPSLHASTSLGRTVHSSWGDCCDRPRGASLRAQPEHPVLVAVHRLILAIHRDRARRLEVSGPMAQAG